MRPAEQYAVSSPVDRDNQASWQDRWFSSAAPMSMAAWRCVESQTDIATTKLVDSPEERDALEEMLEASKPAKPSSCAGLHYLLFTPFRYSSPHGSRFRAPHAPGIWYGADTAKTACAEMAYWRYRFILDSVGLTKSDAELVTAHTIFRAGVDGVGIDLTSDPWVAAANVWTHPEDYSGTQALANAARDRGLEWIRYASVRLPGVACAAVLESTALSKTKPSGYQSWICSATRARVWFSSRESRESFSWDF